MTLEAIAQTHKAGIHRLQYVIANGSSFTVKQDSILILQLPASNAAPTASASANPSHG